MNFFHKWLWVCFQGENGFVNSYVHGCHIDTNAVMWMSDIVFSMIKTKRKYLIEGS